MRRTNIVGVNGRRMITGGSLHELAGGGQTWIDPPGVRGGGPNGHHGQGGGHCDPCEVDCPPEHLIGRRGGAGGAYGSGHIGMTYHDPCEVREFPISHSNPVVPAGQSVNIESKPQVMFRGERLAVPASIVANFDIVDVKIGKDSQLAADGTLPGECFSNLSVGVRMLLDTAEPGILIVLRVLNLDPNNPHPYKSCLFGTVLE